MGAARPTTVRAYVQLVAVMKAAGDSDAADDIEFLGRERAREAICNRDAWLFNCLLQNVLGHDVGYGIGRFIFRALYWVLLISVISTLILKLSVPRRRAADGAGSGASARASPGSFPE